MALLSGKKILVTGVISNRSIAYGVAKAARREGAEIALTYQNERFKDRVTEMAKELGSSLALPLRCQRGPPRCESRYASAKSGRSTARSAMIGGSPSSVVRCISRWYFASSKGVAQCCTQRLSHSSASPTRHAWR